MQNGQQLNQLHSFCSVETLLSSYLAKKEAAADGVELGATEVAAGGEGEPVGAAEFVCEGECVL